ncbi:MAG: TRAP transporter substrate-binding protein DctP [Rhodospirillaceae bacterium]|nr:TRAP transporter substrate-binding protein DctP [Rhodospirillaceae bacterium]
MHHIKVAGIAAIAAFGVAATAQADEWKFALEEIEGSVQDMYAQEFKRIVEEASGGDIEVTIYPYGQLGTSADLTELAQSGVVQLTFASPGHLGTLIPEVQVFSLHYLLSQNNDVNKEFLGSSPTIYEGLAGDFADHGLRLITMFPEGEMVWTTNREIHSPADFDNFKMRTMVSPMLVAAYEALGASPTPMPYGEVYGGLQLGMIDGQVNPIFAIQEMKFYEVVDYMIFAGQQQFTTTVVAGLDWFDGLSPEHQALVTDSQAELLDYIYATQEAMNAERLEMIIADRPELTVIHLTAEEREAFREASLGAREDFAEMVGPSGEEILNSVVAEIEALEAEHGAE